jgi:hypothetical protein
MYLEEAKQTAISNEHKKEIEEAITRLKEGKYSKEFSKLWYMGAKQFVSNIIRSLGGTRYHKSGEDVSGSVYYNILPTLFRVRISGHELPETETRSYNRSLGISGDWLELILNQPKSFSELKAEVLSRLVDYAETLIWELEGDNYHKREVEKIKTRIEEMQKAGKD